MDSKRKPHQQIILVEATNFVSSFLYEHYFTMFIFVDLTKAFETVDYTLLLETLHTSQFPELYIYIVK